MWGSRSVVRGSSGNGCSLPVVSDCSLALAVRFHGDAVGGSCSVVDGRVSSDPDSRIRVKMELTMYRYRSVGSGMQCSYQD